MYKPLFGRKTSHFLSKRVTERSHFLCFCSNSTKKQPRGVTNIEDKTTHVVWSSEDNYKFNSMINHGVSTF